MGLFDKMFGRGAAEAEKTTPGNRFNELRQKYASLFTTAEHEGVQISVLQVLEDKLVVMALAPTEAAKNKVWDAIKAADATYSDLRADIKVLPQAPAAAGAAPAAAAPAGQSYKVVAGDSLSKISKKFYGDSSEYMRIFYANRDRLKLKDPDHIQVGQELVIPPDTDA